MPSSTYPGRTEIEELCSHLATDNQARFFDRVSPNVEWDVLGKEAPERKTTIAAASAAVCTSALQTWHADILHLGTHPAAGHFTTLEDWKKGALGVANGFLREPLKLSVVNVAGGGEQDWAVVELKADSVCKNGMPYNQRYAWVMRFDERGTIVQVRAYLDSELVKKAAESNQ